MIDQVRADITPRTMGLNISNILFNTEGDAMYHMNFYDIFGCPDTCSNQPRSITCYNRTKPIDNIFLSSKYKYKLIIPNKK